jgi:hypothetical protein
MATMLDDVAAVETVARPAARSPGTRAALAYLTASGATAITITEIDGVCTFRIGAKMLARSVAIFWVMELDAKPVVTSARKIAGKSQGAAEAIAALHRAASDKRATLTPHDVAMTRAGNAAAKLDRYLDSLQGSGAFREFTRMYKRRRIEAKAAGQGFMSYAVAEARLRKALIPLLMRGGQPAVGSSLFAQVFTTTWPRVARVCSAFSSSSQCPPA